MISNPVILMVILYGHLSVCACKIPKSLQNYIKSSRRLEKYSITLLMDYERNSTGEKWLEEKFYLRSSDGDPWAASRVALKDRELHVAVCRKDSEQDYDVPDDDSPNRSYTLGILAILRNILQFRARYSVLEQNMDKDISDHPIFINDSVDLVLCHATTNGSSFRVLHPTLQTSYVLVYRMGASLLPEQDIFVLTFAGTLWLCFVAMIVVLAICLNISTKRYSAVYGHPSWGTVDITFWAIAAACQQGLSSTPVGFCSRVIFFLGYLTAYLLYTGFAAGITSLLAVQSEHSLLKISDIERMKINVVAFGDTRNLPTDYSYLRNAEQTANMDSFFSQLDSGRSIGVTLKILLEHYMSKEDKEFDHCSYVISELKDSRVAMSLLVPKHSKYASLFNYWLLRLQQNGLLDATRQHSHSSTHSCQPDSGYSSAALNHVGSAIMLLITGTITSLVFLIIECLWNGYKHRITAAY